MMPHTPPLASPQQVGVGVFLAILIALAPGIVYARDSGHHAVA